MLLTAPAVNKVNWIAKHLWSKIKSMIPKMILSRDFRNICTSVCYTDLLLQWRGWRMFTFCVHIFACNSEGWKQGGESEPCKEKFECFWRRFLGCFSSLRTGRTYFTTQKNISSCFIPQGTNNSVCLQWCSCCLNCGACSLKKENLKFWCCLVFLEVLKYIYIYIYIHIYIYRN